MKKILLLASLVFYSSIALPDNCVIVIFGGSKEWGSLLPGMPTDLSIDVGSEITSQAKKTGCELLTFSNDSESAFFNKLKKLKSSPYNKPGTTYHLAFTDHGAPARGKVLEGPVITGLGEYTTYGKLMNALKEDLPKGAHVTYQTNTCWPNISEAIIASNLESQIDICGGSSTSKDQMSWNLREIYQDNEGKTHGSYGAIGLDYANKIKKTSAVYPSMSDFHHYAKVGDSGNLRRQPGTTTSLAFAQQKLNEAKIKSPLGSGDIFDTLFSINWGNKNVDEFLNETSELQIKKTEFFIAGSCSKMGNDVYEHFLKQFAPVYQSLMSLNMDTLPSPYGKRAKAAKNFFKVNQKNLAALLTNMARERAEFIKKNQMYPKEKYPKVEEEWNALLANEQKRLSNYEFNLRLLQEAQTVQSFFEKASENDRARFQKFLDCESRPML